MAIEELVYIDENGFFVADYPAFLEWLQGEYRTIYGEDVYLEPDSQDGQLLAILARGYYDVATLAASVFNSFSPSTAQGVGLSRNVKINGLERRTPTSSTVDLLITGVTGTVITNGIAIDTQEQKWLLPETVTIPISGSITVEATAEFEGAVLATANTINSIFTPTLGWQSVNNPNTALPGAPVETDAELRVRQALSTANPSLTVLDGTVGAVANLDGVTAVQAYENDTDMTDGNGIPSHSISIVVVGGDNQEIAETIALHKTPGTGTYGDQTEAVTDARGMPLNISFERPDAVTILAEIVIVENTNYSSDYEALIKQAVADAINAFGIGEAILLTRLYLAAYLPNTEAFGTFDIVSIEIAASPGPVADSNVAIAWNEIGVCDPDTDVTVTT